MGNRLCTRICNGCTININNKVWVAIKYKNIIKYKWQSDLNTKYKYINHNPPGGPIPKSSSMLLFPQIVCNLRIAPRIPEFQEYSRICRILLKSRKSTKLEKSTKSSNLTNLTNIRETDDSPINCSWPSPDIGENQVIIGAPLGPYNHGFQEYIGFSWPILCTRVYSRALSLSEIYAHACTHLVYIQM